MKRNLTISVVVLLFVGLGFYSFASKGSSNIAGSPGAKLLSQNWTWLSTTYSGDKVIVAPVPIKFVITFTNEGTFSSTTDCNNLSGNYKVHGSNIIFSEMISTQMYCEGSVEADYVKSLSESETFEISESGELTIKLRMDEGLARFR